MIVMRKRKGIPMTLMRDVQGSVHREARHVPKNTGVGIEPN